MREVWKPLVGVMMLLALVIGLFSFQPVSAEDENTGVADFSLSNRTSELARVFGTASAPGADKTDLNVVKGVTTGNAGAFLGYAEVYNDDDAIKGWLMDKLTTTTGDISYQMLKDLPVEDLGVEGNPFLDYAYYGRLLTDAGLVKSARVGSTGVFRSMVGVPMLFVYLLANAAPFIFATALNLLVMLNPFLLFQTVINGLADTIDNDANVLSTIAGYVGDLYELMQDITVVVVFPLMIGIVLVSALIFHKASPMKKIWRLIIRFFIVFAGLPLIGATYTGIITQLNEEVDIGADYANYLMLSNYVDFQGWVESSRLALPEGDTGDVYFRSSDGQLPSETVFAPNRKLILGINADRAGHSYGSDLIDRYSSSGLTNALDEGMNSNVSINDATSDMRDEQQSAFVSVWNLVSRFNSADQYSPAKFSGSTTSSISQLLRNTTEENEAAIVQMFSLTDQDHRGVWDKFSDTFGDSGYYSGEPIKWSDAEGLVQPGGSDHPDLDFKSYTTNIYNNGSLYSPNKMYFDEVDGTMPRNFMSISQKGGLSTLSMYNFLSTTFDDNGMTVYSNNAASDATRDVYFSVKQAGSGLGGIMMGLETFVVMLSLAVVSFFYAMGLISAIMTNIPRVLSGMFGTVTGSIQFFTKLLVTVAVMIVQILGTIFLYALMENMLLTLVLRVEDFISTSELFNGAIFSMMKGMITIVIAVVVAVAAVRNQKKFTKMMEEVVTSIITKLMSVLDASAGGQGLSMAQTSGGRMDNNGRLQQGVKTPSLGVGPMRDLFNDANALQHQDDAAMKAAGKDPLTGSARGMSVLNTMAELGKANSKDRAMRAMGFEGHALESYETARDQARQAIGRDDDSDMTKAAEATYYARGNKGYDGPVPGSVGAEMLENAQTDEDGSVVTDDHGRAVDASGVPIQNSATGEYVTPDGRMLAPDAPLGMKDGAPATTDSGRFALDANGERYMDENDQSFKADEQGRLTTENGELAALDKDGVIKPIAEVPDADPAGMQMTDAASQLNNMRTNADSYNAMRDFQNTSTYGMNDEGDLVDENMQPLKGTNGDALRLDEQGFVIDQEDNRVPESKIAGKTDSRGFETVKDPVTGKKVMKHKGEAAKKGSMNKSTLTNKTGTGEKAQSLTNKRPPGGGAGSGGAGPVNPPTYGLNSKGKLVDTNMQPLKTTNGGTLHLDKQGFVVDQGGNRVPPSKVAGEMDPRGFATAKDPVTGQKVMKHKGAAAKRAPMNNATQSPTSKRPPGGGGGAGSTNTGPPINQQYKTSSGTRTPIPQTAEQKAQHKQVVQKTAANLQGQAYKKYANHGYRSAHDVENLSTIKGTAQSNQDFDAVSSKHGVVDARSYQAKVQTYKQQSGNAQDKVKKWDQRIASAKKAGSSPHTIVNLEQSRNAAVVEQQQANQNLSDLQSKAHSVVTKGNFKAPGMSRPLKADPQIVRRQLTQAKETKRRLATMRKKMSRMRQGTVEYNRMQQQVRSIDSIDKALTDSLRSAGFDGSFMSDSNGVASLLNDFEQAMSEFKQGKHGDE